MRADCLDLDGGVGKSRLGLRRAFLFGVEMDMADLDGTMGPRVFGPVDEGYKANHQGRLVLMECVPAVRSSFVVFQGEFSLSDESEGIFRGLQSFVSIWSTRLYQQFGSWQDRCVNKHKHSLRPLQSPC